MATGVTKLKAKFVNDISAPGDYSDGNGLVLRVGKNGSKSWAVRGRVKGGKPQTVTFGRYPSLTLAQARKDARGFLNSLHAGVNPNEEARKLKAHNEKQKLLSALEVEKHSWTLQKTLDTYCLVMDKRSQATKRNYRQMCVTHLKEWLQKPMCQITRADVQHKHNRLLETTSGASAKQAMSVLGALFAFLMKQAEGIVETSPVAILTQLEQWAIVKPRTHLVEPEDMPRWFTEVNALEDETLRDYLLFMVFTGVRATGAV